MLPSDDVVTELTQVIWSTMLGLEAAPAGESSEEAAYVTSVDITGSWEGTVSIAFTRSLARRVTAAMLASDDASPTLAEVNDVIAELANMVGGNVKGLFPGPCQLSLPRVEAATSRHFLAEVKDSSHSWFECEGQSFSVTVAERVAAAAGSGVDLPPR